jgi:hypothetical protein
MPQTFRTAVQLTGPLLTLVLALVGSALPSARAAAAEQDLCRWGPDPRARLLLSLGPAQLTPAQQTILRGRVSVRVGPDGDSVEGRFSPGGGLSLAEAARRLGVARFNWLQQITSLPGFWQVTCDPSGVPLGLPLFDPIPSGSRHYRITSGRDGSSLEIVTCAAPGQADCPDEAIPFFANGAELQRQTDTGSLRFRDRPGVPRSFLPPGARMGFTTRLVGIRPDGTLVTWQQLGTNFRWSSDRALDDGRGGILELELF